MRTNLALSTTLNIPCSPPSIKGLTINIINSSIPMAYVTGLPFISLNQLRGKLRAIAPLGGGGFSEVWRGEWQRPSDGSLQLVAIKYLKPVGMGSSISAGAARERVLKVTGTVCMYPVSRADIKLLSVSHGRHWSYPAFLNTRTSYHFTASENEAIRIFRV